ncbi:hypothetical protein Ccrd_010399 [Cynara cardunculus var. scolymus]|uniref:Uncharacterized protein n=1 Tax=Cynara cardunculus var. scolymus TaxID=59895 RepID=A0A118K6T9_CYNCS|nr:hypothetical protein Ccrd_010399 [Cynara cardunculus var. scolymus]
MVDEDLPRRSPRLVKMSNEVLISKKKRGFGNFEINQSFHGPMNLFANGRPLIDLVAVLPDTQPTDVETSDMRSGKMSNEERYGKYCVNVTAAISRHPESISFKNIDLLNTFRAAFVVIDNMSVDISSETKYGVTPSILIAHGCGIFVMRHMETYMGQSVGRLDYLLGKESATQHVQLTRLSPEDHNDKIFGYMEREDEAFFRIVSE